MAKPIDTLDWATDATYTPAGKTWDGTATKSAPAGGYKAQGHAPKSKPPAQNENYYKNLCGQWQAYFDALGKRMHGSAAFVAGLNCTINAPAAPPITASVDFTGAPGQAYSPMPYAVPGFKVHQIDTRCKSPIGGGTITIALVRQADDGSSVEVVASHAYNPSNPAVSVWETDTFTPDHEVEDGYAYYLSVEGAIADTHILWSRVTPG